jgi:endoglycosylceramidase
MTITGTVDAVLVPRKRSTTAEGFLTTSGTWIVNARGEVVVLRGADFRGLHVSDPSLWRKYHTETDYQTMHDWGFNVVRLQIFWSNIETTKGVYNEAYLEQIDRDIGWAKKYGIFVVLDMHQYNWNTKWVGAGAPDWVVAGYPSTEEGRMMAVGDFWKSQELRASFVNMWKYVASRYSKETTVAGYDLLNEPWTMFDRSKTSRPELWSTIKAFYEQVIDGIRAVDSNHIVFVDPWPVEASSVSPVVRSNLVWAPHFYAWYLYGKPYSPSNASYVESDLRSLYDRIVVDLRQPLWIGEFGMEMGIQGSDIWTADCIALFQKYGLGWAWWCYWKSSEPDMYLLNKDGTPRTYFLQYLVNPQVTVTQ